MSNALTIPSGDELDGLMKLADAIHKSQEFKGIKTPMQALMRLVAAKELGIGVMEGLANIYTVNGVPSMDGRLMSRMIGRRGFKYHVIEHTAQAAEIVFYGQANSEGNREELGKMRVDMADAKRAGWLEIWDYDNKKFKDNPIWKKYPDSMLFYRCISKGVRMFCPEVTGAYSYTPEELRDSDMKNVTSDLMVVNSGTGDWKDIQPDEPVKAVAQKTAKALPPFAVEMNALKLSKEDQAFIKADFKREFGRDMPKTADVTDRAEQEWLVVKAIERKNREGKPNEDETNAEGTA